MSSDIEGRDRTGDLDWIAKWLEEIAAVQGISDPRLHDTDGPEGDCLDDCGGCRSWEAVRLFAERVWDRGYEAHTAFVINRTRPKSYRRPDSEMPGNPYRDTGSPGDRNT